MRKLRIPVVDLLRPLGLGFLGLFIFFGLLSWHLGTLQPGMSYLEVGNVSQLQANALSGQEILRQDSTFLPYKLVVYGLEKAGLTSLTEIRMVGVAFGLLAIVGMYVILRRWHTDRIALFTTAIYATSSWLILSARLASPEVCYLLVPWLIYTGIRLQQNNLRLPGLLAITAFVSLMLYVPGLPWLIVPVIIWQRQRLLAELRQAGRAQASLLIMVTILLMLPLILSMLHDATFVLDWLGLAGQTGAFETVKNIVGIPVQLFIRSDGDPARHLGRLPYLDIATTVFVALGAYRYCFAHKLDRSKLIAGGLAVGTILAGLNFQAITVIMPFLYILAAAGIALLLQQWFTVFPRNPLARNTGVVLLVVVLAMTSFYHLQQYFVAWPHNPEARATHVFSVKQR